MTERFYRCRCLTDVEGTGLGLSLVEAVARLRDGELTLSDNNPGLIAVLTLVSAEVADEPHPDPSITHERWSTLAQV